jgi:hypothetical protein
MFNCFVVYLAGEPIGIFRTEIAAENFIAMWPFPNATAEGKYIPGLPF